MLSIRAHPAGLPGRRQRQQPARALGLRRRPHVPDEGRTRRARVSRRRASTTSVSIRSSAATSSIASRRRFGSWTSPVASISTSVSAASAPSRPRRAASPSSTKPSSGARIPERASGRAVRDRPVPGPRLRRAPAASRHEYAAPGTPARPAAERCESGCRRAPCFRLLEADLDRAVAQLHHKAAAFEVQLADSVRPTTPRRPTPSVLPPPGELRAGSSGGRGAPVRHAPRLLRRRTPRSSATAPTWISATSGEGADDEGAAGRDVRACARRPVHRARRVHRLPRVAADPERSDAPGPSDAPAALLQQARVAGELRRARHPARGNAGGRERRAPPSSSSATR